MEGSAEMKRCPFCDRKNITTDIVYEDDLALAFYDIDPINEGHVLLIPKEHFLDADEMPDELIAHLAAVSKKIVAALKKTYRPDGYTVMQNGGKFNDVGHYHLHIFPRYENDGFGWNYGPDAPLPSKETADRIRKLLK
ncbi:MAG: HIT family protein [Clostridia bacterium]|nr:HIT family protein [Clostridia bacterium]